LRAIFVGVTGSDPVQVALHEGELYRDETQIYPIAGNRYFIPVSGFTMKFHRQNMNVDSIVKIYDDGSERVLQRFAASEILCTPTGVFCPRKRHAPHEATAVHLDL
jgi:hypothetical protein